MLVAAIVMEGFSFRTAIVESNKVKGDQSWWSFIRTAKAPELPVVLLEDFAALIGLVLALFGVGLTLLTDNGYWDVAGTAGIGLLLVPVAIVLAIETKSLLLGESAGRADQAPDRGGDLRGIARTSSSGHPHAHPAHRPGGAAGRRARSPSHRHRTSAQDVARAIDAAEEPRIRAAVARGARTSSSSQDIRRANPLTGRRLQCRTRRSGAAGAVTPV